MKTTKIKDFFLDSSIHSINSQLDRKSSSVVRNLCPQLIIITAKVSNYRNIYLTYLLKQEVI